MLAGPEGVGSESDSAPGTLTRSPGLHAPASAAPGSRAPRAAPPPPSSARLSRPSSPGHPPGPALNIPRAPLPLSLFMAVSKLQPPLEQLRPLMGDKAVKAAREAPARPALARPAPARPPGSLGQAARRGGAPSGHASHARANFRDRRERHGTHAAFTFAAASFRPLAPDPLQQTPGPGDRPGGKQLGFEAGEEGSGWRGGGGRKGKQGAGKGKGAVSLLSASSRRLLPEPASEVTGPGR